MSKIDEYRILKRKNENAIKKYRRLLGYYEDSDTTDSTNTNCIINFDFLYDNTFTATLSYNNGTVVNNDVVSHYIADALNENAERIIRRAKVLAQAAIDDAKSESITEAQEIISELSDATTEESTTDESTSEESTEDTSEVTENANDGE